MHVYRFQCVRTCVYCGRFHFTLFTSSKKREECLSQFLVFCLFVKFKFSILLIIDLLLCFIYKSSYLFSCFFFSFSRCYPCFSVYLVLFSVQNLFCSIFCLNPVRPVYCSVCAPSSGRVPISLLLSGIIIIALDWILGTFIFCYLSSFVALPLPFSLFLTIFNLLFKPRLFMLLIFIPNGVSH